MPTLLTQTCDKPLLSKQLMMQVDPSSFSTVSVCEAGQQYPSPMAPSAVLSRGSEATPAPATELVKKKQSLHLEEAKEMCPEGHELSDSYRLEGLQTPIGGMLQLCTSSTTPRAGYLKHVKEGKGRVSLLTSKCEAPVLAVYPVGLSSTARVFRSTISSIHVAPLSQQGAQGSECAYLTTPT